VEERMLDAMMRVELMRENRSKCAKVFILLDKSISSFVDVDKVVGKLILEGRWSRAVS
jgi:hypothetical protein